MSAFSSIHSLIQPCPIPYLFYLFIKSYDVIGRVSPLCVSIQEMAEVQEKLRLQSKELKDAIGQRKLAMTEYTEVSDKYGAAFYN